MTVCVPTERQEVSCKFKEIKRPLANCRKRENHKAARHSLGLNIEGLASKNLLRPEISFNWWKRFTIKTRGKREHIKKHAPVLNYEGGTSFFVSDNVSMAWV